MKLTQTKTGFTLIEIAMTLLLLGIGVMAIMGVSSSSLDAGRKAQDELQSVAFVDMVFGHYQSQTDWDLVPSDLNKRPDAYDVYDYANEVFTLAEETPTLFENRVIDSFGNTNTYNLTYEFIADDPGPYTKQLVLRVWPGYQSGTDGSPEVFSIILYDWLRQSDG